MVGIELHYSYIFLWSHHLCTPRTHLHPRHRRPPIYRMKGTKNRVEVGVLKIQEQGSSSRGLSKNSSVLLPPLSALLTKLQGCCLFVCKIKMELCITHKGFPVTVFLTSASPYLKNGCVAGCCVVVVNYWPLLPGLPFPAVCIFTRPPGDTVVAACPDLWQLESQVT